MKLLLSILLCYSTIAFSQGKSFPDIIIPPKSVQSFDFSTIEVVDDSLKMKLLKKAPSTNKFRIFCEDAMCDEFEYLFPKFHLIDVNQDSLLDIVFSGKNPSGRERGNVAIFMNEADSIRLAFMADGAFVNFVLSDSGSLDYFDLLHLGCCANFENGIGRFKYFPNTHVGELVKQGALFPYSYFPVIHNNRFFRTSTFSYVRNTYFPKKINEPSIQLISKDSWLVPKPDTVTYIEHDVEKYWNYNTQINQAICFIPKETKIQVLYTGSIKGVRYAFITLPSNNQLEYNILGYSGRMLYGWIVL